MSVHVLIICLHHLHFNATIVNVVTQVTGVFMNINLGFILKKKYSLPLTLAVLFGT